jgi:hypothetical protein
MGWGLEEQIIRFLIISICMAFIIAYVSGDLE